MTLADVARHFITVGELMYSFFCTSYLHFSIYSTAFSFHLSILF